MLILHIVFTHGISGAGHYVDVGCNRPMRFSNTFNLYLRGWRGLNIDANRELVAECASVKKEDICVFAAVSDGEREVTFYKAKNDCVSTLDEAQLVEWRERFDFSDAVEETVRTRTLTSVLDEHWPAGRPIDLLTIDVEGHDLQVLRGLDLTKYRPKIVLIEMLDLDGLYDSDVYHILDARGYKLEFFAALNAYFVDRNAVSKAQIREEEG